MPENCLICGNDRFAEQYRGPVRLGKFGTLCDGERTVWRCEGCGAARLDGEPVDYESDAYRQMVDGGGDTATFHRTHDVEQAEKLRLLGTGDLRGRTVADFGAGGGAFLDLAKGFAAKTVAIEPTKAFHADLQAHGHEVFSYGSEAAGTWAGKVDLAVCFSVVEHVEDPLALFREIRALLKPGGRALISTPNRNDWLLDLLPQDYGSFFYRMVHRWYFDAASLEQLALKAGFRSAKVNHVHRFDVSNFLLWLRDRKPSGLGKTNTPPVLDGAFVAALEASGKADYLYAWLEA